MFLRFILRFCIRILAIALIFQVVTFRPIVIAQDSLKLVKLRQLLMPFLTNQQGHVGLSFINLNSGEWYGFNDSTAFNPASVIKIPVMIEAFFQRNAGKLSFEDTLPVRGRDKLWGSGRLYFSPVGTRYTIQDLMERMIQESDNTATLMLMEKLGVANINYDMRQLGLSHTYIGTTNMLEAEGINTTSPRDMSILLYKLYKHELFDSRSSAEAIAILAGQKVRWGIPRYLPQDVIIANKTGSLSGIRNDSGIVFYEKSPYILSIFTSNMPSNPLAKELVSKVSLTIYNWVDQLSSFSNPAETLAQ